MTHLPNNFILLVVLYLIKHNFFNKFYTSILGTYAYFFIFKYPQNNGQHILTSKSFFNINFFFLFALTILFERIFFNWYISEDFLSNLINTYRCRQSFVPIVTLVRRRIIPIIRRRFNTFVRIND